MGKIWLGDMHDTAIYKIPSSQTFVVYESHDIYTPHRVYADHSTIPKPHCGAMANSHNQICKMFITECVGHFLEVEGLGI